MPPVAAPGFTSRKQQPICSNCGRSDPKKGSIRVHRNLEIVGVGTLETGQEAMADINDAA